MSRAVCDPRDRGYRLVRPVQVDGKWTKEEAGDYGRVRFMARSGGYVMCRRPRAMPFVLTEKEWAKMPLYDEAKDTRHAR